MHNTIFIKIKNNLFHIGIYLMYLPIQFFIHNNLINIITINYLFYINVLSNIPVYK